MKHRTIQAWRLSAGTVTETCELIYSPAALYDSAGDKVVTFPELPPPTGGKMGWYHCFPADVCGDAREEVILYDPYSDAVYIYTPTPFQPDLFNGYQHTERQYNTRLMDWTKDMKNGRCQ